MLPRKAAPLSLRASYPIILSAFPLGDIAHFFAEVDRRRGSLLAPVNMVGKPNRYLRHSRSVEPDAKPSTPRALLSPRPIPSPTPSPPPIPSPIPTRRAPLRLGEFGKCCSFTRGEKQLLASNVGIAFQFKRHHLRRDDILASICALATFQRRLDRARAAVRDASVRPAA